MSKFQNLRTSSQKHSAKFYTPNPEKLYNPGRNKKPLINTNIWIDQNNPQE
jgi:hypothetical protein